MVEPRYYHRYTTVIQDKYKGITLIQGLYLYVLSGGRCLLPPAKRERKKIKLPDSCEHHAAAPARP